MVKRPCESNGRHERSKETWPGKWMVGLVESGTDWHGSGAKLVAREDDEMTKWSGSRR